MTLTESLYEPSVANARRNLRQDRRALALLDPNISPALLEMFLIEYSSLAVQMTEPVEGWIQRAGERTQQVGLGEIGRKLVRHAKHEAGHHLMLMRDTHTLVKHWNRTRGRRLDADALLRRPRTRAMQAYIDLHERTIDGERPFGQVAIELEIEGISVAWAGKFVDNCRRVLPADAQAGLSFLEEHAEIDVGHTKFNNQLMESLLHARPDAAPELGLIGANAIEIYLAFFDECFMTARRELTATPALGLSATV
jgi:hypothetical protein